MIRLIVQGMTNKEIGIDLGLSDRTVRNYVSIIMEKLFVSNRAALTLLMEELDIKWVQ